MAEKNMRDKDQRKRLDAAAMRLLASKDMTASTNEDEAAIAETWDALDILRADPHIMAELRTPYRAPFWQRTDGIKTLGAGMAACATIAAVALALVLSPQTYVTRVGEQRLVPLADGSQVTLNTDSRISVHIDGGQRRVTLERGEAYFDVAKLAGAPFVVVSGASEVRVTGTHFNVRRDTNSVRVDVEEGRVLAGAHAATNPAGAAILTANQAVTLDEHGLVRQRSVADIDRVSNWRRGRVYFNETPLRDAVADMNRYTRTRLVIATPGIADMPVSGVYRVGASDSFARALGLAYPVQVQTHDNVIEISQKGHAAF
ncbi:FecR family protein [Asticcacaulis sp. 201]|uniref:FecR family protein n=1 Tax=Asticcacaulis sp. 201 TaxID=3028787 RepID=UPI0029167719|nr:FecR domain-containing protein [Asticcacaulis sp. 201]MDV6330697.1 FecR domain-containing protein [Asticcacaulis sp. 201]